MKTEEDYKIVCAMEVYGGNFVKSLANCFRHADPVNFIVLKDAFSVYWEQYKEMIDK